MSLPLADDGDGIDPTSDCDEYVNRFLFPLNVGSVYEEIELYEAGGFHPVHLGDTYDGGRYRIVHKLGSGGFATVWLARDLVNQKWVALKIVLAAQSEAVKRKILRGMHTGCDWLGTEPPTVISQHQRDFVIKGHNGQHLCLVLPVFGPSTAHLSDGFTSRLRPRLARKAGYEAVKAVAELHSHGPCHGGGSYFTTIFELS